MTPVTPATYKNWKAIEDELSSSWYAPWTWTKDDPNGQIRNDAIKLVAERLRNNPYANSVALESEKSGLIKLAKKISKKPSGNYQLDIGTLNGRLQARSKAVSAAVEAFFKEPSTTRSARYVNPAPPPLIDVREKQGIEDEITRLKTCAFDQFLYDLCQTGNYDQCFQAYQANLKGLDDAQKAFENSESKLENRALKEVDEKRTSHAASLAGKLEKVQQKAAEHPYVAKAGMGVAGLAGAKLVGVVVGISVVEVLVVSALLYGAYYCLARPK